jgi:hypothetical protein
MDLIRRFLFMTGLLAIVFAGGTILHFIHHPGVPLDTSGYALDFRVIYCGAEAERQGHDPYLVEPLRTCEHRIGKEYGEPDWAVTPLPLPSYAIAAVVPLTLLPFGAAKIAWIAILLLSLALAAASLAAIVRKPTLAVFLVLAPTVGLLNAIYGEPVPIAIALLALAAYLLERDRPVWAALAAALATIEPHVALPALVALAILVPRARAALVAGLAAVAVFGVLTFGFARNVEYFTALLPAQARAELIVSDQYSLSHQLHLLGMSDGAATWIGSLSYLLAMTAGIVLARRLAPAFERPGLVLLLPVATAMFGGSYIHDVQIASALPAAILLAEGSSWPARIAIALLVVRWNQSVRAELLPVFAAAAGTAFVAFARDEVRERLAWFVFAPLLALALLAVMPRVTPLSHVTQGAPPIAIRDDDPSSLAWDWRVRLTPDWANVTLRREVEDIPTWLGLVLLFFVRPPRTNPFRIIPLH